MNSNTKFLKFLNKLTTQSQKKILVFENNFPISIFFLFFGFICGNLFGTFLTFFRNYTNWDGAIITLTILIIEFINYLNYTKKDNHIKKRIFIQYNKLQFLNFKTKINKKIIKNQPLNFKNKLFLKFLNFSKIGLLLGFFVDAFKVGS